MNTFIENQNWRYATKKFDASKKISPEDFEFLQEAIRLSASSYGLQPYKVIVVENPELREKLKGAAWNQTQITDASHLIVFANYADFNHSHIDSYIQNIAETRGIPIESLTGFSDLMKAKLDLPTDALNTWTSKQTYIALANLIAAASTLKIDVTPMEGFDASEFNQILGLNELGLNASVIATAGYRHAEDATQHYVKVRKSKKELFINI